MTLSLGSLVRANSCLPRLSRMLGCTQHAHSELHSVVRQAVSAEAPISVAPNGRIVTDQRRCDVTADTITRLGALVRAHRCLPRLSRVLSGAQHCHTALQSVVRQFSNYRPNRYGRFRLRTRKVSKQQDGDDFQW